MLPFNYSFTDVIKQLGKEREVFLNDDFYIRIGDENDDIDLVHKIKGTIAWISPTQTENGIKMMQENVDGTFEAIRLFERLAGGETITEPVPTAIDPEPVPEPVEPVTEPIEIPAMVPHAVVDALEKRCLFLEQQNAQLKTEGEKLALDNAHLQGQLAVLDNLLAKYLPVPHGKENI